MFLLISSLLLCTGALTAVQINSYGNTTAAYGEQAHYRCTTDHPEGTMQVTWQRRFSNGTTETLGTYSNRFGLEINEPYLGKVLFTEASLSSTSITVRNVSWGDEGCYVCSFNVFPDGSDINQICLKVQGISSVYTSYVTSVGAGSDGSEVTFSCSATGKPAPTIQWDVPAAATRVHEAQTTTVVNSDHTVTSSSNVTLRLPAGWNGHVDCLLNTGMAGQRRERIPFTKPNGARLSPSVAAPVVIVLVFVLGIIAVAVVMRHKRLKKNRQHVDVRQEDTSDLQQTLTSVVTANE